MTPIFAIILMALAPIIRGANQTAVKPSPPECTLAPACTSAPPSQQYQESCLENTQPLGPSNVLNDPSKGYPGFSPAPCDYVAENFDYVDAIPKCSSPTFPYLGNLYFEKCYDAYNFCMFVTNHCAMLLCGPDPNTQCRPYVYSGCVQCSNNTCVKNQPINGQVPTDWTLLPLYNGMYYFTYCWQAIQFCIFEGFFCSWSARESCYYTNENAVYCSNCGTPPTEL